MAQYIINSDKPIFGSIMPNVMDVNPRDFLKDYHLRSIIPVLAAKEMALNKTGLSKDELKSRVLEEAERISEELMRNLETLVLPDQIHSLLDEELSKKQQVNLLKGLSISKMQLGAIFVQAGLKGYLFSNYRFEGSPKNYDESELPTFVHITEDNQVTSHGNHKFTEGQLKDIVLQKKIIIARVLDNGKHWHCFYQTSNGVQGTEHGEFGSQPHIHYLSDSFGFSRNDIATSLNGGKAKTSEVHIILK